MRALPSEPFCELGLECSDGVKDVDDMLGEMRCGRLDLVATVRGVRPLKIESSSCSFSAVLGVNMSRRMGCRPWKYAACAFSSSFVITGWMRHCVQIFV